MRQVFGTSPLKDFYRQWWIRNEMQKILRDYQLKYSPLSPEERLKEMHPAFAPAIDIPPEITIRCFEFGHWWPCRLKSETLEYEKGIVPFNSKVELITSDDSDRITNLMLFIRNYLSKKWSSVSACFSSRNNL